MQATKSQQAVAINQSRNKSIYFAPVACTKRSKDKDSKNTSICTSQANEPARTDKGTGHGVGRPGGAGAAATAKHARPNQGIQTLPAAKPSTQAKKTAQKGYDPRQGRRQEPGPERRRRLRQSAPARRARGPGAARRLPWCEHGRDPNQRGGSNEIREPPTDRPFSPLSLSPWDR